MDRLFLVLVPVVVLAHLLTMLILKPVPTVVGIISAAIIIGLLWSISEEDK